MRIMPVGWSARLVEVDDHEEMLAFYRGIDLLRRTTLNSGIVELVPGARTVLVEFDSAVVSAAQVDALIAETSIEPAPDDDTEVVEIEIVYDGADIDVVCGELGLQHDEFVTWHSGQEWSVAFTGFAPGFGYLTRPDHHAAIPRLEAPRTRVPAGAIGMADVFTGIYPVESPGGWQIVGSTDHVLFDLDREPAATLLPGRRVRFREGVR
ncbi:MAG: allophanate hydrolase subunit 1 [Nocardioidaceae bacterium]